MKLVVSLFTFLALTLANKVHFAPLSDEEISYINSLPGNTWKAGRNVYQNYLHNNQIMTCVNIEENKELFKRLPKKEGVIRDDLPTNFDPREKWKRCPSLNEVRDQSNCGSCWAMAPAEAITDRICIKQSEQAHISAEDVISCAVGWGSGCEGGSPTGAWQWWVYAGIVTGGEYGTKEGCRPYSLPHCDRHTTGKYPQCKGTAKTPTCRQECIAGYNRTYEKDKRYGSMVYGVVGMEMIMQELIDEGPVTAPFLVYSDFLSYKSGVYKHVTGEMLGGHAVKIIGYGVENGTDYWLATNSWNTDWGDKGFFKIARGVNECEIEGDVIGGTILF